MVVLSVLPNRRGRQSSLDVMPSSIKSAISMVLSMSTERDWARAKPSSPTGRHLSPERSMVRTPRGAPHAAFNIKSMHEYALFAAACAPATQPPDTRHRNDNQ